MIGRSPAPIPPNLLSPHPVHSSPSQSPLSLREQPDGSTKKVCYIAAHTAVIFDCVSKTQLVLQGHCNPITCLVATADRSYVAPADAGPDAIKKALNDMDQNGDNEVNIMEFKRYFLGPWAKMQMAKQFKDVGVDVNGEIDLETLRRALNAMGSAPNDQILNEMFAKVDAGKRGSVPVAKFVSWATYQIK